MSSDEYYNGYDVHASKSSRKRGSFQSRRRRSYRDRYHKPHHSKTWHGQNAPRIMAAFVFLFLICYEIFILKGPLLGKVGRAVPSSSARLIHPFINTSKSITTSPSLSSRPSRDDSSKKNADNSLKKRKTSVGPSKSSSDQNNASPPPSPYPKIISAGTTAADTPTSTTGNANKVSQYAERSISPQEEQKARVSSYKPLRRKKYSKLSKRRKHRAPSVLNIERHAADEDDTSSSGKETKNKRKTIRGSKSIVHSSQPSAADEDTPPTRTKRTSENGAEPGAGENFWQWFQDTKGSEKQGVSISIPCPEENKRLCEMFYKYLRKYKIRCIYDVSCGKNYDWMPAVVKKAGNELWGFKYYCSVSDGEDVDAAKQKLGKFKFVEFVTDPWWKTGYPEDTELLFAWDTLAHIAYGRVWNFFVKAKKQEVKYLLVDNYPGILNDPSPKRNYLNLRKHPFRFPAAKEVVQNVTETGEKAKRQLLFYETNTLPDNLQ